MCEVARIASRKPMPRSALTTWDGKHLHGSAANRHGIGGETESSVTFRRVSQAIAMRLTNAGMMHLFDSSPRRTRGDGSTQKRHEKRAERIGPFYAVLNKGLSAKAAGQALKSGHRRQPFNPFGAPVGWAVWGFCSSRGAAGRIALVFSRLFRAGEVFGRKKNTRMRAGERGVSKGVTLL